MLTNTGMTESWHRLLLRLFSFTNGGDDKLKVYLSPRYGENFKGVFWIFLYFLLNLRPRSGVFMFVPESSFGDKPFYSQLTNIRLAK